MVMDENPYKAPQEQGTEQPPGRQWAQLLDLAKLLLVAILLTALILLLFAVFMGPSIGHGPASR
jgi:hypothetical protein